MKQFISAELLLALQKMSQTGFDGDARTLKNGYEEFVMLVFSEDAVHTDKVSYRNMLVYTRVELASLTEVTEKKCSHLFR